MSNFAKAPTGMVLAPAQNQVIQFQDESGNAIQISQQDVLQYICPQASPREVVFFMELCRAQKLNPFLKEAFLIKYGNNPASIVTAEIVFERRANAHPQYRGMECGVTYLDRNGSICQREGTATYKAAGEVLVGGWARVHRKDRSDSYAEVSLEEYNKNQSVWKSMPGVMIQKCAKGVALRQAFPSDFQGMYLQEEMGAAPDILEVHAEVVHDAPQSDSGADSGHANSLLDKQAAFNDLVANLASLRDTDAGAVASAILASKSVKATGYQTGEDMTEAQLDAAIAQAAAWIDKARQAVDEPEYEVDGRAELFDTDQDF